MTTKMAINAKDLFRNQHRLIRIIEQSIRMCSNQSIKQQQQQQKQQKGQLDADFQISKSFTSQLSTTVPEPIVHDDDVGQQFSASALTVRLATPQQLQPKPDNAEELGFGKLFTDHMLKIYWHKSLGGWQQPQITPLENLVMHPAAKVLHYAVELFEGMKAYRGVDDKIRIFRPNMNMNRMNLAAKRSGLPTFEGEEFVKCLSRLLTIDSEWVPHTEAASLYIRPTLIGIDPTLGVAASDSALLYAILSPVGSYFKSEDDTGAVSLLADPSYTRAWPGGAGNRKMGSNYAPTINVQKEASRKGLQQVLWLYGDDHQLTEVGTMNIFMFFINENGEKELRTPPLNGLILPGITRDSILALTRQWGKFKVTEEKFNMHDIENLLNQGRLLELFGTGTACVVSPVNRISYMGKDLYIPTMEQEKPVHETIRETLMDIQYGKVEHPWSVVIE
ncbi:branched chain amino acid transaminase isoform X2 [Haematobia irritans]|uniref:branched chain amino acid transaminase isoform X2 n=1 Tax=Haematobia irritans TaxID=7368 RepID=UPI003F50136A